MAQSKNIIILIIIVGIGILFWLFPLNTNAPGDESLDKQNQNVGTLAVTHHFENGVHTYSGTVSKPTPCHIFESEVIIRESFPEQVTLDLTIKDSGQICIQVIGEEVFTITFEASEKALVDAAINGERFELVVTEI